ncbi:DUF2283 domain-containing protein [Candidatus Kaiserbacteria bacterium]|nr:DUF2283 domain-containing protein [Candidatus Kaiserbacteria bacterium]
MNIKYDIIADAVYVNVGSEPVAKTHKMDDRLLVDMDKAGKIVGIEILDASSQTELIENLKRNVEAGIPIDITSSTPASQ